MKRGDVVTVSGGADYANKPRPAVVVQDDRFPAVDSVTICPFTSDSSVDAPLIRLFVRADPGNGLRTGSKLMIDKIVTVPVRKIGPHIGRLNDDDLLKLDQALRTFLGLWPSTP